MFFNICNEEEKLSKNDSLRKKMCFPFPGSFSLTSSKGKAVKKGAEIFSSAKQGS